MNRSRYSPGWLAVWCVIAAILVAWFAFSLELELGVQAQLGGALVIMIHAAIGWSLLSAPAEPTPAPPPQAQAPRLQSVDPWAAQRELMVISGQGVPGEPTLSGTSVLYLALCLEEVAEGLGNTAVALRNHRGGNQDADALVEALHGLRNVAGLGASLLKAMIAKHGAQAMPPGGIRLYHHEAVALFDDAVDIAVVAAGFGVASGFPMPEGYADVVGSNLSKRNPETGVIDKTPDGKWIKGSAYRPPDLARVLAETQWGRHQ